MKNQLLLLIFTAFLSINLSAQTKKITIKVKDSKNKPVSGALILFDNVKQKVWTNAKGIFKAKINTNPKIISAFHPNIGIVKTKYNGENSLTLIIKKGNDLQFSDNSPKQKIMNAGQFNDIYDYLRGKIPGVNVSSENTISIRGYSSINGNMSPLFILNGTNVSQEVFGRIIPNDIKSVTVLKGPETARYGVRGANGVIIVKTK